MTREAARANKSRNAAHFEFQDVLPGDVVHRSLYLDTLGAAARRSPSPVERYYNLQQRSEQQCCDYSTEGYEHGSLSTSGIQGASPCTHTLTKHQQLYPQQQQQQSAPESPGAADTRPKRAVASTNKPDFIHSTADIDGAQPWPKDVCHHPRGTNPLSPEYKLATGSGMPYPLGPPASPDKPSLRDALDVSDIPGAVQRPKTPAARAAAARAEAAAAAAGRAAAGSSSSSSGGSGASPTAAAAAGSCQSSSGSNCSSRPGVLEVADIDGAFPSWRPTHRRHVGGSPSSVRDTCLNVSDINTYMARFKPAPRNSAGDYKGHPGGPRVPSPVKPRTHPSIMDNSLRKFDIEGTSVRLAPRATHITCLDVGDIEGTHPAIKDRAAVFAALKATSAAAAARQQEAQAVLSGLQLQQQELLQLWRECSKRDKDKSGFLTAQELVQAMQKAQLQLPPSDTQRLAAALSSSVGLLNYRQLTRQLKGNVSRPASALAVLSSSSPARVSTPPPARAPPPFATWDDADMSQLQQQRHRQRPHSAVPGSSSRLLHHSRDASTQVERVAGEVVGGKSRGVDSGCNPAGGGGGSSSRPSTAPARPCSAPATGRHSNSGANSSSSHETRASAQRWHRNNREGASVVSHWFAGSRRDAVVAAETTQWRPGPAAAALAVGWGLNGPAPWSGVHADDGGDGGSAGAEFAAAADVQAAVGFDGSSGSDVVPAWMVGADALHGTCRISQPFGDEVAAAATGLGLGGVVQSCAGVERLQPAAAAATPPQRPQSAGARLQRPGSSHGRLKTQSDRLVVSCRSGGGSGMGLAERRRLMQSEQQDLQAVRMLG